MQVQVVNFELSEVRSTGTGACQHVFAQQIPVAMRTAETGTTYLLEVRPRWRTIPVSLGAMTS